MQEIQKLRKEIDVLDRKIAERLAERQKIVGKIVKAKKEQGLPLEDLEREKEIVERLIKFCDAELIKKVYAAVFEHGKK